MKYAILLECDPQNTLGGSCIRDVKNMAEHLISRCNLNKSNIHILTTNSSFQKVSLDKGYPTYSSNQFINVITNVKKMCTEYDTIIILISGHGYQIHDSNGDEQDGLDEMISVGSRNIIDDEIYLNIRDIKSKVIMLSDTCHSGTMFDLPKKHQSKNEKFGNLISISACSDAQLSMCDIGEKTGFGGSLTTSVLEDGVLELLINDINDNNVLAAFNKLISRLLLLNQTAVLSTN